jgi:hypothetical protein
MRSKPIAGRHLGWTHADLATKPYARFLNAQLQPLPAHIRHALHRGPVPEPLLPAIGTAAENLFGGAAVVEDGFALTADGVMLVAARTDMPGVTPPMIDWWFGWQATVPNATNYGIRTRMCTPRGLRRLPPGRVDARAMSATRRSSTSISAAI